MSIFGDRNERVGVGATFCPVNPLLECRSKVMRLLQKLTVWVGVPFKGDHGGVVSGSLCLGQDEAQGSKGCPPAKALLVTSHSLGVGSRVGHLVFLGPSLRTSRVSLLVMGGVKGFSKRPILPLWMVG